MLLFWRKVKQGGKIYSFDGLEDTNLYSLKRCLTQGRPGVRKLNLPAKQQLYAKTTRLYPIPWRRFFKNLPGGYLGFLNPFFWRILVYAAPAKGP